MQVMQVDEISIVRGVLVPKYDILRSEGMDQVELDMLDVLNEIDRYFDVWSTTLSEAHTPISCWKYTCCSEYTECAILGFDVTMLTNIDDPNAHCVTADSLGRELLSERQIKILTKFLNGRGLFIEFTTFLIKKSECAKCQKPDLITWR